jgi:hypothetical protein
MNTSTSWNVGVGGRYWAWNTRYGTTTTIAAPRTEFH